MSVEVTPGNWIHEIKKLVESGYLPKELETPLFMLIGSYIRAGSSRTRVTPLHVDLAKKFLHDGVWIGDGDMKQHYEIMVCLEVEPEKGLSESSFVLVSCPKGYVLKRLDEFEPLEG